ncbi:MAG: hypothetical protein Satyrvirus18_12 [Satyrvirus sp.]|uniref:Uncharacterized protein n=1 Tax=Satyrvirus sp. TaxID=2487771 RepID=A0A3G5AE26_9VIRU|nr:MAG: hypothetical protein Satyrvirus18_12 [Satyrvirus sp.]
MYDYSFYLDPINYLEFDEYDYENKFNFSCTKNGQVPKLKPELQFKEDDPNLSNVCKSYNVNEIVLLRDDDGSPEKSSYKDICLCINVCNIL